MKEAVVRCMKCSAKIGGMSLNIGSKVELKGACKKCLKSDPLLMPLTEYVPVYDSVLYQPKFL